MKEEREENYQYCRRIAEEIENVADGKLYRCPHCGNDFCMDDAEEYETEDGDTAIHCPNCNEELLTDELEPLSVYDYFSDALDIEFTIDAQREYKGICIWVTVGGPSIWVDTNAGEVKLAWWGERATAYLSRSACDAIDEYGEELYNC